jgi:hypothetical protein
MRINGLGHLHSIDLPSYDHTGPANRDGFADTLPPSREPGWVIPAHNRSRWSLTMGASCVHLSSLLEAIGPIDLFLHDSEHTYETMSMEMALAWPALREGGILICDNITASAAFDEFCQKQNRHPVGLPELISSANDSQPRFGVIRK